MSRKEIQKNELDGLRDVLRQSDTRAMWTLMRQLDLKPVDVPYYIFFNGHADSHIGLTEGYLYDLITIQSFVEVMNPAASAAMNHNSFEEFAASEQHRRQDQLEEVASTPNEVWRLRVLCNEDRMYRCFVYDGFLAKVIKNIQKKTNNNVLAVCFLYFLHFCNLPTFCMFTLVV